MTDPVDWAPFASDGEQFRMLPPLGMPYCLTTDDIFKARPTPSIRRYLHGQVGDKMLPETWLPKKPPLKYRNLETRRVVDPLDPKYELPSGTCLIPAGDPIPFSNRVTDLMDTSDICGSKPGPICKRPLRTCRLHCYIDDASFHPTKWTHVRRRTRFGQGLDLFDIDTGKRQFGFNRAIISNPLEPIYSSETEDLPHKNPDWRKRRVLPPHKDEKNSLEKILDKIYGKAEVLPLVCRTFDPDNTKQISYGDFRKCLERFGVKLSEKELREVFAYADKEHLGHVRYNKFAKVLRTLDNWEKTFPQRLGAELGCPQTNANLGQGVQVLVDFKPKIRHPHERDRSIPYDFFTGEPFEGSQSDSLHRDPLSFSYTERAAAVSKLKHEMGIASLLSPLSQRLPKHQVKTRVGSMNPSDVQQVIRAPPSENTTELCTASAKEVVADCILTHELSSPIASTYQAVPTEAAHFKLSEENMAKRQSNPSPKKSRQASIMPYKDLNSLVMDENRQMSSPPRCLKSRHVASMPFKQRMHKEQHSADLHAVQILS